MMRILMILVFAAGLIGNSVSHATYYHFFADLSGPAESPTNASPGIGVADVFWDTVTDKMEVKISFSGLLGNTTASHIHSPTAFPNTGTALVATTVPRFLGFPTGVTSGSYDNILDMTLASSYNPAFVTAHGGTIPSAEAALLTGLLSEEAYLNIHTDLFPGGEIRGFLHAVPEPGSLALLGLALVGVAASRRHKPA